MFSNNEDMIRQAFLALDRGCHGYITLANVRTMFATVAPSVPPHVVDEAFVTVSGKEGRINWRDFNTLMKTVL